MDALKRDTELDMQVIERSEMKAELQKQSGEQLGNPLQLTPVCYCEAIRAINSPFGSDRRLRDLQTVNRPQGIIMDASEDLGLGPTCGLIRGVWRSFGVCFDLKPTVGLLNYGASIDWSRGYIYFQDK